MTERDAGYAEGTHQITIEISDDQHEILERAEEELGIDREFVARQALAGGVKRLAEDLERDD